MNCLEALKLAKDTGCKVQPMNGERCVAHYTVSIEHGLLGNVGGATSGKHRSLELWEIINPDGSEVLWERVEEGPQ